MNGQFYLYYGGLPTGQNTASSQTSIGVATSSDGIHFTRANNGYPIYTPAHTNGNPASLYGAGQPSVFYIAPYYYLSFTDTTASGANPYNGAGQFMMRSLDPLFQSGDQELIGNGQWANRAPGAHTGQFKYLEAMSIDIAYDSKSGKLFISSDQQLGQTWIYLFDSTSFVNYGYMSLAGTWADGASIAKNSNRTLLGRSSCESVDLNIYKGDSPSGQNTAAGVATWNISRSEGLFQLNSNLCPTPVSFPALDTSRRMLQGGWELYAGNCRAFGDVNLCMQTDGNFVLYQGSSAVWATSNFPFFDAGGFSGGTYNLNCAQCYAVFQTDGNLVLYNPNSNFPNHAYWASRTNGYGGATMTVTGQAPHVTISDSAGDVLFAPISGNFTLGANQCTPVGNMSLCMQGDGNLVIYRGGAGVWATSWYDSFDAPGFYGPTEGLYCWDCYATFQGDGNLVLYNPYFFGNLNRSLWSSGTNGNYGAFINVTSSSPNVTVRSAQGTVLWAH